MDFRQVLTENWPYKTAAVVLSILMWLSVSAEQERNDQQVPTRLEFVLMDTTWSLRDAPGRVMTTFQGRGADILQLFDQPRTIRKVIDTVDDTVMEISLSASDVLYDRSLDVIPSSVDPGNVTVRFEERVGRYLPVRAAIDAHAQPGFIMGAVSIDPDSVWLQGPVSLVNSIVQVSTDLLDVGEVNRRIDRQLGLALPEGFSNVQVTPTTVFVSVGVDTVRTRQFERTVAAVGAYAAGIVIDPPQVMVEVTGGATEIGALRPTDLQVLVDVSEPIDRGRTFLLSVRLPPDLSANARLVPATVNVSPRSDPSTSGTPPE